MGFLTLGVVSNVWGQLLPHTSLAELCGEADRQGYQYVELRQGSLGNCEHAALAGEPPVPDAGAVAGLAAALPSLRFNLAVEVPFLAAPSDPEAAPFPAYVAAAAAVGGPQPVLRLVDLSPVHHLLTSEAVRARGADLARLTRYAHGEGARLVVENSRQPLSVLRKVIGEAGQRLGEQAPGPGLCWDPANMINTAITSESPLDAAPDLGAGELAILHFKQTRGQVLQPHVEDGDIDWQALLRILKDAGYQGPALFEIPAGEEPWACLARSRSYIEGLLAEL